MMSSGQIDQHLCSSLSLIFIVVRQGGYRLLDYLHRLLTLLVGSGIAFHHRLDDILNSNFQFSFCHRQARLADFCRDSLIQVYRLCRIIAGRKRIEVAANW